MRKSILIFLLGVLVLAACTGQEPTPTPQPPTEPPTEPETPTEEAVPEQLPIEHVTGTATYEESVTLPDDAIFTVQIQDTSLADAPATIIGEQSYVTAGEQVPLSFEASYNPADIEDNHRYSLSIRITDAVDNLLFTNDTVIPVITNDNPTSGIEAVLIATDAAKALAETDEAAEVTGTILYRERIALPDDAVVTVQLQDTSLADAAATILGEQTYVTEGAQVPLPFAVSYNPADIQENHEYSLSVRITGADGNLLFINDTVIPVITNGNPTSDIEVVVISTGAGAAAAAEVAADSIFNKTWQWVSMTDPAVGPQEIEQPQRYQLILNDDGTANIKADCNSVQATYTMDGSSITFTLGATTLVACPPDSLADDYLKNLEAVGLWFTEEGDLFFDLIYDSGTMRFSEPSLTELESMLLGPIWEWTDYREANVTTAVPTPESYLIQFMPDGMAFITADCNNILAEWTLEEDSLSMLLGPTTLVFCGEESLDQQFIAGLTDGGTIAFDDQGFLRLTFNATDGEFFFRSGGEQVTGEVTYLPRIALPEDAVLEVSLQDVSLADAPATLIGFQTYKTDGAQVPLPYAVSYNPDLIIANHTYTVAARIYDGEGNLLFINDTSIPVINNGETTDVEILVVQTN